MMSRRKLLPLAVLVVLIGILSRSWVVSLAPTTNAMDRFTPPGEKQRRSAIGSTAGLPPRMQRAFDPADHFEPIPTPGPSDWLTPHVRNIVWRDCDIIRVETGAVFSIHNGDSAVIENVQFENIRVEDARDKLVDFRVGLSIYSQDCPERYHRRNPNRKPTGAGPWVPWEKLTAEEQAVARQNRGAIRNVRLADIQLLEKIPPRSFLVNSGGEVSGVTFQNLRQGDRVLASSEDLGLSVEGATAVRFAR